MWGEGMWLSALQASPPAWSPETCGWLENEGRYSINWFEGDISPQSIEDVLLPDAEDDTEDESEEDDSEDDFLHADMDDDEYDEQDEEDIADIYD